MSRATSSNNERDPYLKLSFWLDPSNQFWNKYNYSEASRDYYRKWLNDWAKREKYLPSIDQKLS